MLTTVPQPVVGIGISLLYSLLQTHPGKVTFTDRPTLSKPFIDYLAGTDKLRLGLIASKTPNQIMSELLPKKFCAPSLY